MTSAARKAYETLEPFHVLAYFNPGLGDALAATGLDPHAFYTGARGAPLGDCDSAVVASAFYNFAPAQIDAAWTSAKAVGLDVVADARNAMLEQQFAAILGGAADQPQITELADRYGELAASAPYSGRPLAAAWAAADVPSSPIVRLWHRIAVLREWRGDNHIAALVVHGLDGIDACTFHEAQLLDPAVKRRSLGKRMTLLTRGWTEDDWEQSVDRLVERGVAERVDAPQGEVAHRLTPDGAELYDDIEAMTDALGESLWSEPGMDVALTATRPLVKAVIDAGVLPGAKKR
ncbi:MAG: hypothetical protein QM658_01855 [Gordonia sp. (in: high G+C Gram-positive bacteria)]